MFARIVAVAVSSLGLLALFGCGGGGGDFYGEQKGTGGGGGGAGLDIAGTYQVVPDTFGFNTFTITQSGNTLSAFDNGGGSWSGTLSNITIEETTGANGGLLITWRADVNMTGRNAVGDDLTLSGVVEITPSGQVNLTIITAEYQNVSIGLTGQLVMTQVSAVPGAAQDPAGGGATGGGSSGRENK
jgi:hypothetical protein